MTGDWVMAVGGVDPSGGAGLSVDRAAIESWGLTCATFATAQTDQDDGEVRRVGAIPGAEWLGDCLERAAIHAPRAVKFGLLPGRDALRAATSLVDVQLESNPNLPVVLDPVLVSSSGFRFVLEADYPVLLELCRRPLILTPNLPELAALTGRVGQVWGPDPAWRLEAAQELLSLGLRGVIVKDGHGEGGRICDWLSLEGEAPRALERERIRTPSGGMSMRGTGCRFASHLAAGLALGLTAYDAAWQAGNRVAEEISKGR